MCCGQRTGLIVIKPSGVPYEELSLDIMVVVNFEERWLKEIFLLQTPNHIDYIKLFPKSEGCAYPFSVQLWAELVSIPTYGTAGIILGEIPCTKFVGQEIESEYEKNTGLVIVETFITKNKNPIYTPRVVLLMDLSWKGCTELFTMPLY